MPSEINRESDIVFTKSGNNVYVISKDRFGYLSKFIALDEPSMKSLLKNKEFKVSVFDRSDNLIVKNYQIIEQSSLNIVRSMLEEVSNTYNSLLEKIDDSLARQDKEDFIKLTDELYGGTHND